MLKRGDGRNGNEGSIEKITFEFTFVSNVNSNVDNSKAILVRAHVCANVCLKCEVKRWLNNILWRKLTFVPMFPSNVNSNVSDSKTPILHYAITQRRLSQHLPQTLTQT